jgi:glucose-1-phosphatase
MTTILFDFWGTLVENGVWSPIKQVRNILQIRLPFSDYVIRMEKAMMTKEFDSLREAFVAVCDEFNIKPQDFLLEELIGMWNKSWMLAKPFREAEETLRNLQQSHTLILVSNTDCVSVKNVLDKFKLKQYFDHIFLSCEVGMIKTNPEFLTRVLKEAKVDAKDCVLVGDSTHSDMKAAEQAGIKGILVDRRGSRDYQSKISNLRDVERLL